MSISDERVARALRRDPNDTLIPQTRDGFEGMTYHEAAYRFWDMCRRVKSAANVDIAHSTTNVLADFIDPTCHVVQVEDESGDRTEIHDCCGDPHTRDAFTGKLFAHCPNCGARVVSE